MGHLSLGPCRHHTSYHIPKQQRDAGSALVPDGCGTSDNSSEAMMAKENGGSCPKSSPHTFLLCCRWWLHTERSQTRHKCQNRVDITAATRVLNVTCLLSWNIRVPQMLKGATGCRPVNTQSLRWYNTAQSKNQRELIPSLAPSTSSYWAGCGSILEQLCPLSCPSGQSIHPLAALWHWYMLSPLIKPAVFFPVTT